MKDLFQNPLLYLITPGIAEQSNYEAKKKEILEIIRAAVDARISLIQIREKKLAAKMLFELTSEAVSITAGCRTKILVNERADIAFAAKAEGVHLPSDSLSADVIRRAFPRRFLIGVSAHSIEEAKKSASDGADFVTFGPIFDTPDKGKPKGLKELERVCTSLGPFPVIALGGINAGNYQSVLQNGAQGFAAIRYLNDKENLRNLPHGLS